MHFESSGSCRGAMFILMNYVISCTSVTRSNIFAMIFDVIKLVIWLLTMS